jgi:hypothetical protein
MDCAEDSSSSANMYMYVTCSPLISFRVAAGARVKDT